MTVKIIIAAIALVCTGWFVHSRYSLRPCTVRTISEAVRFADSHPECHGSIYVEAGPEWDASFPSLWRARAMVGEMLK